MICFECYLNTREFIHSVFCLTTGSKPPPKGFFHIVRSRASSFEWEYHLLSLTSSSSFLRLLPRLLVTSISRFIFPSITCFRRQFLRKIWPIQLAFRFVISCKIFLCSLTLSKTSSFLTWSVQLIFSILLQHCPISGVKDMVKIHLPLAEIELRSFDRPVGGLNNVVTTHFRLANREEFWIAVFY